VICLSFGFFVVNKGHVFHFFPSDWVNDRIGLVLLVPIASSQGDDHVGCVYAKKVVLGQVLAGKIL
jgi:hypothetical protein